MAQYAEIRAMVTPGRGFLPIVSVDGKEVYRGEYRKDLDETLAIAKLRLEGLVLSGEVVFDDSVGY